jgi:hypothetical protein
MALIPRYQNENRPRVEALRPLNIDFIFEFLKKKFHYFGFGMQFIHDYETRFMHIYEISFIYGDTRFIYRHFRGYCGVCYNVNYLINY